MTGRELLVREARRYVGTKEEPKGSNRGLRIDYWLDLVGSPLASAWCAAFVTGMGLQAVGRGAWPFKVSGGVQDIVSAAGQLLTKDLAQVRPGDLMVLFFPSLNRYAHIGIVETVAAGTVDAIEGNTDDTGGREGYIVARRTRSLTDRVAFLRWPGNSP